MLAAHARTAPHRVEVDELALAIRTAPASLLFVGHLTPRATQALAVSAEASPESPTTPDQFVTVRSGIDLRAAAERATPPFAVERGSIREALRSAAECGPFCLLGAVAQPLGWAGLLLDLGANEVLAEGLRYRHDSSLGPGALSAHVDLASLAGRTRDREIRMFADLAPAIHLAARVEGAAFGGAIGVAPQLPFEVPGMAAGPHRAAAPEPLECLERLELSVVGTLGSLGSVDAAQRSAMLTRGRAEATAELECVTDPALRTEADAYLEAMDVIGGMFDETTPDSGSPP